MLQHEKQTDRSDDSGAASSGLTSSSELAQTAGGNAKTVARRSRSLDYNTTQQAYDDYGSSSMTSREHSSSNIEDLLFEEERGMSDLQNVTRSLREFQDDTTISSTWARES